MRSAESIFIGQRTRQPGTLQVDVAHQVLRVVIGLTDTCGIECIGFDDVGSCLQILAVYVLHHIGPREAQHVVVSFHLSGQSGKTCAAKIGLCQVVSLYHGAHGAVQHEDALLHRLSKWFH